MGYAAIGFAFGIVMFVSALVSGWGLGLALLIGWLGASLGVVAVVALAAMRLSASSDTAEKDPLEV
ncbi:hypothetical protein [Jannaschia seohaensis]|uniref:Uncharacterized protein n=1 Tax=Jannaschia seohaensis TaxID=475081 RepID=A0A2Y9AGP4_9RHOB|nr:hypothetical protein [Jannaschia seohaensis]PWJ21299.1 hypothetical protein BCF38_102549 [Jannaschia seohaensis]SSA41709.1 hypothetical protein SAMN05421539_102549 [Jannaschia seohaensis]